MGDRGFSEILEAEQYFIQRLADLADGLQARDNENVSELPEKTPPGLLVCRP
jgi:hypothetical protein